MEDWETRRGEEGREREAELGGGRVSGARGGGGGGGVEFGWEGFRGRSPGGGIRVGKLLLVNKLISNWIV